MTAITRECRLMAFARLGTHLSLSVTLSEDLVPRDAKLCDTVWLTFSSKSADEQLPLGVSRPKHQEPLDFILVKHGHADVPTYLAEIDTLRGLLFEAYRELSTVEAALALPGGPDEIDGLMMLLNRIHDGLLLERRPEDAAGKE